MTDPTTEQPRRRRRSGDPLPHADPGEARQILSLLKPLIEPLQRAIPGHAEVVLHDFSKLPNTIVAIAGDVTGRTVGSPATDSLLKAVAAGEVHTTDTYDVRLPGGRELRSTNVVFHDSHGVPAYALSVIVDVTIWRAIHVLAETMLPQDANKPRAENEDEDEDEHFSNDVDALAQQLLTQALAAARIPVDLMQKRHKIAVVDDLKKRGFFLLKDSVETAASALGVTRFTVYNYLNELDVTG